MSIKIYLWKHIQFATHNQSFTWYSQKQRNQINFSSSFRLWRKKFTSEKFKSFSYENGFRQHFDIESTPSCHRSNINQQRNKYKSRIMNLLTCSRTANAVIIKCNFYSTRWSNKIAIRLQRFGIQTGGNLRMTKNVFAKYFCTRSLKGTHQDSEVNACWVIAWILAKNWFPTDQKTSNYLDATLHRPTSLSIQDERFYKYFSR